MPPGPCGGCRRGCSGGGGGGGAPLTGGGPPKSTRRPKVPRRPSCTRFPLILTILGPQKNWSGRGLNSRLSAHKTNALPTELQDHISDYNII